MSNVEHFYFALEWLLRRSRLGLEPRIESWAAVNADLANQILCEGKNLPPALKSVWSLYNLHSHEDACIAALCRGILARYAQAVEAFADIPAPEIPPILQNKLSWEEKGELLKEDIFLSAELYRARVFIYNLTNRTISSVTKSLLHSEASAPDDL